ncbi:MAG: 4-(cytidine 5'-diphospho)-2-C-methyl-D-erythritol kinase [Ktedonobacteraceae bacterium]
MKLDKSLISVQNAPMSHAQQAQIPGSFRFVRAYAKINLTLDVLGKRTDGYHALATVMQTIDLYDTLCLTLTEDPRIEVICDKPELSSNDNLAARAAESLLQRTTYPGGLTIELVKRIPVAAGLGGGSSDAAAVLCALQQWWKIPVSQAEMVALAASLGSDVPFFLTGGLALCEGRGEVVTPLSPPQAEFMRWVVLVKPPIGLSTATIFRHLSASDYTDGRYSRAFSTSVQANASPYMERLHNSLERGVLERYPEVARAKADILHAGAQWVQLSGSGPTLFAPFPELKAASDVQQRLQAQGYNVYLSHPILPNSGNVCVY